jgi:hypothetical protein
MVDTLWQQLKAESLASMTRGKDAAEQVLLPKE